MIRQIEFTLPRFARGTHIITNLIMNELRDLPDLGMLNIFIKHTSAGITINENADATVRVDFEAVMNKLIPENEAYYTHTLEGADDLPSHLKSSLIGQSLTIPIKGGQLNMGTWQGIYLCEFRNYGSKRKMILTIYS